MPVDPFQAQRIDIVQRAKFAMGVPPPVSELAELVQFAGICVGVHAHESVTHRGIRRVKKKSPAEAGLFPSGASCYLRVPITSISTRRFFCRPSFVLFEAT